MTKDQKDREASYPLSEGAEILLAIASDEVPPMRIRPWLHIVATELAKEEKSPCIQPKHIIAAIEFLFKLEAYYSEARQLSIDR